MYSSPTPSPSPSPCPDAEEWEWDGAESGRAGPRRVLHDGRGWDPARDGRSASSSPSSSSPLSMSMSMLAPGEGEAPMLLPPVVGAPADTGPCELSPAVEGVECRSRSVVGDLSASAPAASSAITFVFCECGGGLMTPPAPGPLEMGRMGAAGCWPVDAVVDLNRGCRPCPRSPCGRARRSQSPKPPFVCFCVRD